MATESTAERTYVGEYGPVFEAVRQAAAAAGLNVAAADPATGRLEMTSSVSLASWGERMEVQVGQAAPGSQVVRMRSALKFGLVDWGKNKRNVERLLAAVDALLAAPAAGWHADPSGRHEHRYWDGAAWTDQVSDGGVASVDPP